VLTARLSLLVEEGVLERRRYQERPERFEYRLTEKGLELFPVLISLMQWGDGWYAPDGAGARAAA
jgi:DNA-binding HxlR family transcriptional regulator